jgi:hypothetical protein
MRSPLAAIGETIERLLIVYDWGESFVGLNLALKPLFDQLFMKHLGEVAPNCSFIPARVSPASALSSMFR